MSKNVIIAFDVGTSNVKAAAVDVSNGEPVALESSGYPLLKPQEGYLEIDPEALWGCLETSFRKVFEQTKDTCKYIGIGFSWFADCVMLADENGKPLTNILQYADSRAAGDTLQYFMKKDPVALCKEKDLPPISMFIAPRSEPLKVLWFKQNQPEVFAKARYMFDNQQFILSRLGLEPVNDDSLSAVKRLEILKERRWSDDLLDLYEIPREFCAERIVSCTENLGTVDHIGSVPLPYPVPVIIGTHDEICGMVGVGALPDNPGVIANIMGTSDTITYLADYTGKDEFPQTGILPVRTPYGTYNVGGHGATMTGASLDWFVKQFLPGQPLSAIDTLLDSAKFDASNPVMMVPNFGRNQVGMRDLSLSTTPQAIFTALVEGITFELYYNMLSNDEQMFKETGEHIRLVASSGGASRNDAMLQLRASVFGLPIERSATTQACSVGAAAIAAVGLGVYNSFKEAADHMAKTGKRFEPDERQREAYLRKEEKYRGFHDYMVPPRPKH